MLSFAFLGHPASLEHVAQLLPRVRPGLDTSHANPALLAKAFEWSSPFATDEDLTVTRPDGTVLHGKLIICPFLPEHAHSPRQLASAYQKTRAGAILARDLGAQIIGLGGFTSIVGGAQGERLPRELGIAATSGNSLTAALAIAQIQTLLQKLDRLLANQTVAILGATGDIGKACALALIQSGAKNLILIARNRPKLEHLQTELSTASPHLTLSINTDPLAAIPATLIIAATSAATPLLTESDLRPGTIFCDIGYPATLAYSPEPRPEVLPFQGGLALSPFSLPITHFTNLPGPNLLHGCLAETLTLALADRYESYSLGQGHITLDRLQAILTLATSFGFQPAPLYRNNYPLTDSDLQTFKHATAN